MLRCLVITIALLISVFCTNAFAETIMWYLPINHEKIIYTVDIDSTVDTNRMNYFNHAIRIIADGCSYSNLQQLEDIINRTATGEIKNFTIVDVVVDEK